MPGAGEASVAPVRRIAPAIPGAVELDFLDAFRLPILEKGAVIDRADDALPERRRFSSSLDVAVSGDRVAVAIDVMWAGAVRGGLG